MVTRQIVETSKQLASEQVVAKVHFRYRKVTPDVLKKMKLLRSLGYGYRRIAREAGVCVTTAEYHLSARHRRKTVLRARKSYAKHGCKPKSEARKKANAEYYMERYHKDPVFRARVIRANNGGRFKGEAA